MAHRAPIARRWLVLAAVLAAVFSIGRSARAHDVRPGVLSLVERAPNRFAIAWTEPVDSAAEPSPVEIAFPASCRRDQLLACDADGLAGEIAFSGLAPAMRVVVVIRWLDGRALEEVVSGASPRLSVARGPVRSTWRWIGLGAEHVLGGLDHLAFLLGLLLLVTIDRRLVLTVTAFTVAHSITLALSVLGWLSLPPAPVEATIAASVLLVAREALHDEQTLTRRAPWAVAGVFGLVHGLGFAGALRELGLPAESVGRALLSFNVGVELGQLAIVALALAGRWMLGRPALERWKRARPWLQRGLGYGLGALGACWLLERTAAIVR